MNELITIDKMTSMQIAEVTNKEHYIVMRDIRDEVSKLESGGISTQYKFVLSERQDSTGRTIPYYELTGEGVLQLAARYDAVTRAKLIDLAMKHDKPKIPQTYAEALRLAADLEEERQKLLPKAQGYDYLMNASGTVTIGEAAAIIGIKGIGQNKFFNLLVAEEIIFKKGNSYVPYSGYLDKFIVKQNPIKRGSTIENRSQLYLDMKGLDWLAKLLAKRGYGVNYRQNAVQISIEMRSPMAKLKQFRESQNLTPKQISKAMGIHKGGQACQTQNTFSDTQ